MNILSVCETCLYETDEQLEECPNCGDSMYVFYEVDPDFWNQRKDRHVCMPPVVDEFDFRGSLISANETCP